MSQNAPEIVTRATSAPPVRGIVWNILGQVYIPKQLNEETFAWQATFPIETFVPPHIHPDQDEYLCVTDGELDCTIEGEECKALPGEVVHLPKGIPHGLFNNSGKPVTGISWVEPTGTLFELFKAIHSVGNPNDVVQIAAEFNVEFLSAQQASPNWTA